MLRWRTTLILKLLKLHLWFYRLLLSHYILIVHLGSRQDSRNQVHPLFAVDLRGAFILIQRSRRLWRIKTINAIRIQSVMLGAKCVRLLNLLIIVGGMVRRRWIIIYAIIIPSKFHVSNIICN